MDSRRHSLEVWWGVSLGILPRKCLKLRGPWKLDFQNSETNSVFIMSHFIFTLLKLLDPPQVLFSKPYFFHGHKKRINIIFLFLLFLYFQVLFLFWIPLLLKANGSGLKNVWRSIPVNPISVIWMHMWIEHTQTQFGLRVHQM